MDLNKLKKIYCVGIGGIGMSAVARWALQKNIKVSGSDIAETEITKALRKEGADIIVGHTSVNIPDDADLVIYTPAVDRHHVERGAAKKKKIPQVSYPEFLGLLSKNKFTIAVTGTHGKSTTTAKIGLMLENAGFDPTVFVGSLVPQFEHGNVRVGESNFLVVEACEHQGNMRLIKPNIAVVTAIEPDHLDFYKDLDHAIRIYQEFINLLPKNGVLIKAFDCSGCQKLQFNGKVLTFGLGANADIYYSGYKLENGRSVFNLHSRHPEYSEGYRLENTQAAPLRDSSATLQNDGMKLVGYTQKMKLGIPGEFNVRNVLAATLAAREIGVPEPVISKVSENFSGMWRRFEKVGEYNGSTVISDYAHHPTAIRETMRMVRDLYPDQRIILVYQPHQHNRTLKLFNEFVDAFAIAPIDVLVLNEIYDVAGREADQDKSVSSIQLLDEIRKIGRFDAYYTATLDETHAWLVENVKNGNVVVIMGAGDIDLVARRLIRIK